MSQFLELPQGVSKVWVTEAKFVHGNNDKPRNKISLRICEKPSQESFESLSTSQDVYLPMSSDSIQAKIAMERRIKAVLYPLAGFQADKKCSLKELFSAITSNLANHDISADVDVSHREGNQADRNGNVRIFIELNALTPTGFLDKKPFESSIDFEDFSDIPF